MKKVLAKVERVGREDKQRNLGRMTYVPFSAKTFKIISEQFNMILDAWITLLVLSS